MRMTRERYRRAKELFRASIELPEEERQKYLEESCGSDQELVSEVESLLEFDSRMGADDFGVLVGDSPRLRGVRSFAQNPPRWIHVLLLLILCLAGHLWWLDLRKQTRERIALDLQRYCEAQSRAVRTWEQARIRETQQASALEEVCEVAAKLVAVAQSEAPEVALRECKEVGEFYQLTKAYSDAHGGAALHLVSQDGIVLADTNPAYLGKKLNAEAFKYLLPAIQGDVVVTPLVQDGSMVTNPPFGVSDSVSHSYVIVPIEWESKVIAALAAMEYSGSGYIEIIGDQIADDFFVTLVDEQGRIIAESGANQTTPKRPTYSSQATEKLLTKVASASIGDTQQRSPSGLILDSYRSHRGIDVVGAWHWVPQSSTGVIVELSAASAFWPVNQVLAALSLLYVGCAIALAWKPTARIVRRWRGEQALVDSRYRIERLIGEGGSSTVYQAVDDFLERRVAVKIMRADAFGRNALRRFRREIQLLAALEHPATVTVFDAGLLGGDEPFFVMEHVSGSNMGELVARSGPYSEDKAMELLAPVCSALAEAHRKGIIHRDIKPQNIVVAEMANSEPVVKLLDFGLGKDLDTDRSQVTTASDIAGTIAFMPPEALADPQSVGQPADVYSFGATLYFLLTAQHLFPGESSLKLVHSIASGELNLSPLEAAGVSGPTRRLVAKCLERSPDCRFHNAFELHQAFVEVKSLLSRHTDRKNHGF